jgi:hypothetical protein
VQVTLAKRVRYVELTVHPSFTDMFAQSLGFGRTSVNVVCYKERIF